MNNRKTGAKGEKLAAAYLELMGYEILDTNYHAGIRGEIDIVAQKGAMLVFAEVKLRMGQGYGSAAEAVDMRKQSFLSYAAQHYMAQKGKQDSPARFDVIALQRQENRFVIDHIENAFECISHKGW